ncbi:hypothetical protein AGMMS50293_03100 [Spirochaetia bacterium]|nr:hypothetical protein AGMMS50293_03100 [Spirochaetia bacterium]
MKKLTVGFFVLMITLVIAGCATTPKVPPVNTFFEQGDDGWVHYFTNDRARYGFQQRKTFDNPNSDPNVYEVDVKKISGFENMGFGLLFGAKDDNNFYVVNVYVKGIYGVRKSVGGTITNLTGSDSPLINQGFDVVNSIKVVKGGAGYDIYLNGNSTPVYTVTDTSVTGNKIGYYVLIGASGYENFPDNPVDVRFKIK